MLRRRLIGALGTLAMLAFLVGVPAATWIVARPHLPHSVPTVHDVTQFLSTQDTGQAFVSVLVVIAAAGWGMFAAALLTETWTAIRQRHHLAGWPAPTGRAAPPPAGMRWSQSAARRLVGAAALLFIGGPIATAAAATPHGTTAAAAVQHAGSHAVTAPTGHASHHDDAGFPHAGQPQTVHGHDGRTDERRVEVHHGDTLWSIAERQLGDGNNYQQIAHDSRHIRQPDGEYLTDPDLIKPGWHLDIPAAGDGHHGDGSTRHAPAAGHHSAARQTQTHPTQPHTGTTRTPTQPGKDLPAGQPRTTAPPRSTSPDAPSSTPTATPAPKTPAANARADQTASSDDGLAEIFTVRNEAGVGAILAAGVIGLLGARRMRQHRRRQPGTGIPLPTGPAADTEEQLRATADPLSVDVVDRALRTLAHRQRQTGQPLPAVRAARLTEDQFDLYLAEPAHLPAPWTGTADGTVWTLPADLDTGDAPDELQPAGADGPGVAVLLSADDVHDVPAPFPSLVTIGHDDEDGHVFVDLEYLANLTVTDPGPLADDVIAALAVELATSRWADDLQVTLVGARPELGDILDTGRIRYLPATGHLIDNLAQRANHDRQVLADTAGGDLRHARAAGEAPSVTTPEIVLLAGTLTDQQRHQLHELAEQLPRVAIATVTTGDPVGEWCLRLDEPDSAVLEPVGLRLRPQRLRGDVYETLLEAVAVANDTQPLPRVADATERPVAAVHRLTVHVPASPTATHPATAGPATVPSFSTGPADDPYAPNTDGSPSLQETADGEPAGAGRNHTAAAAAPAARDGSSTSDDDVADQPATLDSDLPAALAGLISTRAQRHGHEQPRSTSVDQQPDNPSPETNGAAGSPGSDAAPDAPATTVHGQTTDGVKTVDGNGPAQDDDDLDNDTTVARLSRPAPRLRFLGPPVLEDAAGPVEDSKKARLLELGIAIKLHPGCNHHRLDQMVWPNQRIPDSTRHTAMSKLRRWIGEDEHGVKYMPDYSGAAGYTLGDRVTDDWEDWRRLIPGPATAATTEHIEQALSLVRGRPFEGVKANRYAFTERLREDISDAISDAAYELARRRLIEGRWRAAEQAAATGITVEPGAERLWRARIIAAYASGNTDGADQLIARLTSIVESIGADFDPETEQLLDQLNNPHTRTDQLAAAL